MSVLKRATAELRKAGIEHLEVRRNLYGVGIHDPRCMRQSGKVFSDAPTAVAATLEGYRPKCSDAPVTTPVTPPLDAAYDSAGIEWLASDLEIFLGHMGDTPDDYDEDDFELIADAVGLLREYAALLKTPAANAPATGAGSGGEATDLLLPRSQVLTTLRRRIDQYGTQKAVADLAGVSQQYVCDVLRERRRPSGDLLTWLGYAECELYSVVYPPDAPDA